MTVDGDRSTNDTLLVFATGASGAPAITRADDPRLADFAVKLEAVLLDLAQQLVRDGEGASKFVKVTVTGARNEASAMRIARTIAESPLVKTAFAGEDANWGRIVMAVGRADEPVDRDRMSVRFGPLTAAKQGRGGRRLLRGRHERLHEEQRTRSWRRRRRGFGRRGDVDLRPDQAVRRDQRRLSVP